MLSLRYLIFHQKISLSLPLKNLLGKAMATETSNNSQGLDLGG